MNDDRIGESLRALPPEAAAPEFTAAVLSRVEAEVDRGRSAGATGRPRSGRLLWAGAVLAAAGVAVVAGFLVTGGAGVRRPAATGETAATGKQAGVGAPRAEEIEPAAVAADLPGDHPAAPFGGRTPLATPPGGSAAHPPPRPRAGDRQPGTALAAARPDQPPGLLQARAELAELRSRHRRFASELRSLEDFAGDGGPVLYLGGDEALEVVLRLGPAEPGTVPAATHSGGAGTRPAVEHRPPPSQPFY